MLFLLDVATAGSCGYILLHCFKPLSPGSQNVSSCTYFDIGPWRTKVEELHFTPSLHPSRDEEKGVTGDGRWSLPPPLAPNSHTGAKQWVCWVLLLNTCAGNKHYGGLLIMVQQPPNIHRCDIPVSSSFLSSLSAFLLFFFPPFAISQ